MSLKKLIGFIGILALGICGLLWYNGIIVFDHSANVYLEGMEWNGKRYSEISGAYSEGKTIARTEDGSWDINEVEEDPSHTFVVAQSILDQHLYVADDYDIPESGKLTLVAVGGERITDESFLAAMVELDASKVTSFEYVTADVFTKTDTLNLKSLYFAYEGCPVATIYKGQLGIVEGKWVITTYMEPINEENASDPVEFKIGCYEIPEEYVSFVQLIY